MHAIANQFHVARMEGSLLPKSLPEGVFVNSDGRHDERSRCEVELITVPSGIGVSCAIVERLRRSANSKLAQG